MAEAVLEGRDLVLVYAGRGRKGLGGALGRGGSTCGVVALSGVSLAVEKGEVVAVVGASGSGKSSLVKVLACLQPATSGEVYWQGLRVDNLPEARRRPLRPTVQVVFQEPGSSFNPRHTVGFALREALRYGTAARHLRSSTGPSWLAEASAFRRETAREAATMQLLFSLVGLPFSQELLARRIHEFSGGQRQRLSLARALAAGPEVLLLDEPVASLDVPVRRHFLASLRELVARTQLAAVVVTHDLSILDGLAHRVVVLLAGRVVEEGPWPDVKAEPMHPYTAALLQAAAGSAKPQRFFLPIPSGCPFRPVCPKASPACLAEPTLEIQGKRKVACFHPLAGNISRENLVEPQREGG